MTTETPEEFRQRLLKADNQFYEDTNKRTEPYRNRAFEYEKLGVEYTHRGFQALTYLNGGALVAIPTAMAFFKADVGKVDVLWTASAFILGLLCVVLAQLAAFFVMLKRVEENTFLSHEQFEQLAALQFPHGSPDNLKQPTMQRQIARQPWNATGTPTSGEISVYACCAFLSWPSSLGADGVPGPSSLLKRP
jgi:hypothetical protein